MQGAFRWQALAVAAGLMVSMEAGAKETKAAKPAPKPAAVAKEPAAPKASEVKAAKAPEPSAASPTWYNFGREGQLVFSSDASADFGFTSMGDYGYLRLQPAADYFLKDRLSLGGATTLGFAFGEASGLSIGLTVRGGYNLPLGEKVSWWPRLGLGFLVIDDINLQGGVLGTQGFNFQVDGFAPVLVHLTPHFFLGGGPRVGLSIGDEVDVAFSLNTTLGGYF